METEFYNIEDQNENMDQIDAQLKALEDEMQDEAVLEKVEQVKTSVDELVETVGTRPAVNDSVHGKLNTILNKLEEHKGNMEEIGAIADHINNEYIVGEAKDKLAYLSETRDIIKAKIIAKGQNITNDDTFRSYGEKIENISKDATAGTDHILLNQTAYSGGNLITGAMSNNGAVSSTLTNQNQTYTVPKGYHSGSGTVRTNISNLTAANIKKGISVGGIVGTAEEYITRNITFTGSYDSVYGADKNIVVFMDATGVLCSLRTGERLPQTLQMKGDSLAILFWETNRALEVTNGGYFVDRDGDRYTAWFNGSWNTYSKGTTLVYFHVFIPTSTSIEFRVRAV